jgi:Holliday junction DNA helicase RuvA
VISRIHGRIRRKKEGRILLEVESGICYEVILPESTMRAVEKKDIESEKVTFITYHYFQTDPSKSIPILIGFLNEIEKEFFEKFITVSGVGPKAACRALALPISEIADAIDTADLARLKTLPGIGEQRAKEIIAKLQGKVGKFGLLQDRFERETPRVGEDVKEEALAVLLQLQYRKKDAMEMIEKALQRNPNLRSGEEILNAVYKVRQGRES